MIGEIDIDGRDLDAFGTLDRMFLEAVAALLSTLWPVIPETPTIPHPAGHAALAGNS